MHPAQQQILYVNLELLKDSYKLPNPQSIPWTSFSLELKLQNQNNDPSSIRNEIQSEELTQNPFSKTKQLFKSNPTYSKTAYRLQKTLNIKRYYDYKELNKTNTSSNVPISSPNRSRQSMMC